MRLPTLLFAGMSLGSVPLCGQTVDVHTHIIISEYMEVLKANLQRLSDTWETVSPAVSAFLASRMTTWRM